MKVTTERWPVGVNIRERVFNALRREAQSATRKQREGDRDPAFLTVVAGSSWVGTSLMGCERTGGACGHDFRSLTEGLGMTRQIANQTLKQ